MALDRVGVMFPLKNPKSLKMSGKLQVTAEQMLRWKDYPIQEYKDKKYVEIEIGMFENSKGEMKYYPLCEFLPKDDEGGQAEQPEGGDDSELPF